ncbi:MAG: calcium-binding protein [Brasilonema sp.]
MALNNVSATQSAGGNVLFGNPNGTTLTGSAGNDTLFADADDTILIGDAGNDTLFGKSATTRLEGGDGNDTLFAGEKSATLIGGAGKDTIFGDSGADRLEGGDGDDLLSGGAGNDILVGGSGADRFIFSNPNQGIDQILDFNVTEDKIEIQLPVYIKESSGSGNTIVSIGDNSDNNAFGKAGLTSNTTLSADQFYIGEGAASASDRFIYNSTTGGLFFDVDGTGSSAQIQLATLSPELALTSSNIFIA